MRLYTPSHFATADRVATAGAIVAFRMRIRRRHARFKLSQNRSNEDHGRVVDGLQAEGHPDAAATAEWMLTYASVRRRPA